MDPHEIGSKWVFDDMWGFTADVSQPVLLEFFKALIVCANADGELTDAERATTLRMAGAVGVDEDELAEFERIYAADRALRAERIKAVFPVATPY